MTMSETYSDGTTTGPTPAARRIHHGTPTRMRSTCSDCGYQSIGGTVMPWFDIREDGWVVRDDVSYLCRGCETVTEKEIEVLETR